MADLSINLRRVIPTLDIPNPLKSIEPHTKNRKEKYKIGLFVTSDRSLPYFEPRFLV